MGTLLAGQAVAIPVREVLTEEEFAEQVRERRARAVAAARAEAAATNSRPEIVAAREEKRAKMDAIRAHAEANRARAEEERATLLNVGVEALVRERDATAGRLAALEAERDGLLSQIERERDTKKLKALAARRSELPVEIAAARVQFVEQKRAVAVALLRPSGEKKERLAELKARQTELEQQKRAISAELLAIQQERGRIEGASSRAAQTLQSLRAQEAEARDELNRLVVNRR